MGFRHFRHGGRYRRCAPNSREPGVLSIGSSRRRARGARSESSARRRRGRRAVPPPRRSPFPVPCCQRCVGPIAVLDRLFDRETIDIASARLGVGARRRGEGNRGHRKEGSLGREPPARRDRGRGADRHGSNGRGGVRVPGGTCGSTAESPSSCTCGSRSSTTPLTASTCTTRRASPGPR